MENLFIRGTNKTPMVLFRADGNFIIRGRLLVNNSIRLFKPLFNWLSSFHSDKITFKINLEHMNSRSSIQLFNVLKNLDENSKVKKVKVFWYYDKNDEKHLETGQIFADCLGRTTFKYHKSTD